MWFQFRLGKDLLSAFGFAAIVFAAVNSFSDPASAARLKTLYSFCKKATACPDGLEPLAGLIIDHSGNLFGTTQQGGAGGRQGKGVVFGLFFDPVAQSWKEQTLYKFCSKTGCTDGATPLAGVIIDSNGNLYGTTLYGGSTTGDAGIAFELTPVPGHSKWALKVLSVFCPKGGKCPKGANPVTSLAYVGSATGVPYDGTSPLYGTADQGGHVDGVAFQLIPQEGRHKWAEQKLFDFRFNGPVGYFTSSSLFMDAGGDLFGTTEYGGTGSQGTAFELPSGQDQPIVLYQFCSLANCPDGENANGPVVDETGSLFGTTSAGGANGKGILFKLAQESGRWSETILHDFCAAEGCPDGSSPRSPLISDAHGNLYGSTSMGGASNGGTIFRYSSKGEFTTLYSFCAKTNCTDGGGPIGNLAMDSNGNLFGVTESRGKFGEGSVFELKP